MRNAVVLGLLGLLFPATGQAIGGNRYLAEQVLPVVVDSATYQSEIYVDADNTSVPAIHFRATYYGGDGTVAPGKRDCGEHAVYAGVTMK